MAQKDLTNFDLLRNEIEAVKPTNGNGGTTTSSNPFDLSGMGATMIPMTTNAQGAKPKQQSMNSLLGEHSNLVNLDNLVTDSKNQGQNPFENVTPNPLPSCPD